MIAWLVLMITLSFDVLLAVVFVQTVFDNNGNGFWDWLTDTLFALIGVMFAIILNVVIFNIFKLKGWF